MASQGRHSTYYNYCVSKQKHLTPMYLKMSNFKCTCEMKSVIKRIKEIIKYKNRKSRKNIREKKKSLRVPISLLLHAVLGIWYQIIIKQGIHHIFYKITPRQHLHDRRAYPLAGQWNMCHYRAVFKRMMILISMTWKGREGRGRGKIMVITSHR